ncbi:MAG: hypothetical protein ACM3QV_00165 [Caulobacteraceae bacterium]
MSDVDVISPVIKTMTLTKFYQAVYTATAAIANGMPDTVGADSYETAIC